MPSCLALNRYYSGRSVDQQHTIKAAGALLSSHASLDATVSTKAPPNQAAHTTTTSPFVMPPANANRQPNRARFSFFPTCSRRTFLLILLAFIIFTPWLVEVGHDEHGEVNCWELYSLVSKVCGSPLYRWTSVYHNLPATVVWAREGAGRRSSKALRGRGGPTGGV
ncbi:hypothetical protein LTR85_003427 [Meristemomyces frigidus]|nr:hypothetical protein LTR85_003427 [Meristemomyces frigidus]